MGQITESLPLIEAVLKEGGYFALLVLILLGGWKLTLRLGVYLKNNVVDPVVRTHVNAVETLSGSYQSMANSMQQQADSNRITAEAVRGMADMQNGQTEILRDNNVKISEVHSHVTRRLRKEAGE